MQIYNQLAKFCISRNIPEYFYVILEMARYKALWNAQAQCSLRKPSFDRYGGIWAVFSAKVWFDWELQPEDERMDVILGSMVWNVSANLELTWMQKYLIIDII